MMRDVVIFGASLFAERMLAAFERRSDRRIAAFTVDPGYADADTHHGYPLVPFDRLASLYPPDRHEIFPAVGYSDLNAHRARICEAAAAMGYALASYIAPGAAVLTDDVGPGSCIFENATVEPLARIGTGVVIGSGAVVAHHSQIGDYCYLSAGAIVAGQCRVGPRCFLGARSVLRDGIDVAGQSFVGIGSVVTRSIEVPGTYVGHPARRAR